MAGISSCNILILSLFFCCLSFAQDIGDEFDYMLSNNCQFKDIQAFLVENKENINRVWGKGSFLQIAASHKKFYIFSSLLNLGIRDCYIKNDEKEYFLLKAVEAQDLKIIYFILGKGDYKSSKILKFLYVKLLDEHQLPKIVAGLSSSITKYIEEYENDNFNILKERNIDTLFLKLSPVQINSILLKIISTPNLPIRKEFLLPFLDAFKLTGWDYELFPDIFNNIIKLKSSICIPIIEELLKTIPNILNDDNSNNIILGIVQYLDINKNLKIRNSENLEEVIKIIINRLLISDKLINKYFCLRLLKNTNVYSISEREIIINEVENYLSNSLNSNSNYSFEDKICLFSSFFILDDYNVCIKKYFKKICDLHCKIVRNKKLYYDDSTPLLRDIHFFGLDSFNKFDNGDYGLEKLLALLRHSDKNSEKIHYIKTFLDLKLSTENIKFIKKNLKNIVAELQSEINVPYKKSIEELQEICKILELNQLQDLLNKKIKNEQSLVGKLNIHELKSEISLIEFSIEKIKNITMQKPQKLIEVLNLCYSFVTFGNEQRGNMGNPEKNAPSEEITLNKEKWVALLNNSHKKNQPIEVFAEIIFKEKAMAIKYERGVICHYGEECTHIFVLGGPVKAMAGDSLLKDYSQGDILGEMNLFKDNPKRTATLVAEENCEILKIPIKEFEKKVRKTPGYISYLIETLIKMIQENNKFIQEYKED